MTAASASSSTASILLTATTSAAASWAVTSGSTISRSIGQRGASTRVSTRIASTLRAVVDHHAEEVARRGEAGRLDDHPVRVVPALDGEEGLYETGLEGAADAAAEEFLHRQALLAHVAAVDADLADLVLDDGEPCAVLGHGPRHLEEHGRLARAQEAGDAEDVHAWVSRRRPGTGPGVADGAGASPVNSSGRKSCSVSSWPGGATTKSSPQSLLHERVEDPRRARDLLHGEVERRGELGDACRGAARGRSGRCRRARCACSA